MGESDHLKVAGEVQKRPCLYNFKISDYGRKEVVERAWNEVSQNTKLTVQECKEKWKNIRTAFVRSLKPAPPGSSAKLRKPYYLHDQLQFLVPYIKPTYLTELSSYVECPQDRSDLESEASAEEAETFLKIEQTSFPSPIDSLLIEQQAEEEDMLSISNTLNTMRSLKRKRDTADVDGNNVQNTTMNDDETAKRYFLLSLLPDVRGLDESQMRHFKIKVLMLIDDIKGSSSAPHFN